MALQEVGALKETENSFSCKLGLGLTWTDHRVSWRGLRNNSNINRQAHNPHPPRVAVMQGAPLP